MLDANELNDMVIIIAAIRVVTVLFMVSKFLNVFSVLY